MGLWDLGGIGKTLTKCKDFLHCNALFKNSYQMCHNLLYPFQYFLKSQTFIWVGFVVHRDRERGEEREDRVVGREFRCRRTFSSVPPSAGGGRPIERSKKGESVEALKTPKLKHFHWPDEQLDWPESLHNHQQQLQQADRSHKRCFSRLLHPRIWIWRTFCHSRWKGTLYHDKCCKRIFFVFTSDNLQLVVSENFTLPEDMVFGEAQAIAITTYRWNFFLSSKTVIDFVQHPVPIGHHHQLALPLQAAEVNCNIIIAKKQLDIDSQHFNPGCHTQNSK